MYLIHRSIDIDFSHHIRGHQGGCINIHGHTWKFEVGIAAHELDGQGFVVDFGDLSRDILRPCHALLDHGLAVGEDTFREIEGGLATIGERLLASRTEPGPAPKKVQLAGAENRFPGGMKVAVFPFAPTSERLSRWLFEAASERFDDTRVRVEYTRIYETLHPVESVAEYRSPA
ncbi:MAG: 6-carboxytetrahydropterin synthase [Myxococcota bacterium]